MNSQPPMMATAAIGTLTRKTEPHEKCSSSQPPLIGPAATPTPTIAAHSPIAFARFTGSAKMFVISDERGREDHRRADAHGGARPDQRVGRIHLRRNGGGDRKQGEPGTEKAPSAEAVAQAACRQHQTGHDERVGVDDPLQLCGVGVEFSRQRGQRDVDDGGVDADDEDAQADEGKRGNRMISEDWCACTHGQDRKPFRQVFQVI